MLDKMLQDESTVQVVKQNEGAGDIFEILSQPDATQDMFQDVNRVKDLYRHNITLIKNYSVSDAIKGDILAVEAKDNTYTSDMREWENHCSGLYEHRYINGAHADVLSSQNLPVLASYIHEFLEKTAVAI